MSNGYTISTDKEAMDVDVIHAYLTISYWAMGISRDAVERAVENSLCFGVFHNREQVGFARAITDQATLAYIEDVFVLEPHRGKGLSRKLLQAIVQDPRLKHVPRMVLQTRDAHGLYRKFGFEAQADPGAVMERCEARR